MEQPAIVVRAERHDIDASILRAAETRWLKVARIIGTVMTATRDPAGRTTLRDREAGHRRVLSSPHRHSPGAPGHAPSRVRRGARARNGPRASIVRR
ncbi:hypothetical protein [Methylobacterium sp. JK268]